MIKLDVCCGQYKQEGFTGMDIRAVTGVDIVHNVCKFPWPFEDNSCNAILMRLAWQIIEPKYRIHFMDECWRILAPDCKLQIIDQYYKGDRAHHDPIGYSCPNEWTFLYYTPNHVKYKVYEPKPWNLLVYEYQEQGLITVVMTPIKESQISIVAEQHKKTRKVLR